nr:aldehyde dehydrogenase family protein [Nostoc sp. DedSLP05]MDZ8101925.1 aldehyde dehydrogenase family protein [Nostoc sp. DedSLP01]
MRRATDIMDARREEMISWSIRTSPIMKRASLELGGNSPLVVLDDADLELAVKAAVFGKFLNSGQICSISCKSI